MKPGGGRNPASTAAMPVEKWIGLAAKPDSRRDPVALYSTVSGSRAEDPAPSGAEAMPLPDRRIVSGRTPLSGRLAPARYFLG